MFWCRQTIPLRPCLEGTRAIEREFVIDEESNSMSRSQGDKEEGERPFHF